MMLTVSADKPCSASCYLISDKLVEPMFCTVDGFPAVDLARSAAFSPVLDVAEVKGTFALLWRTKTESASPVRLLPLSLFPPEFFATTFAITLKGGNA